MNAEAIKKLRKKFILIAMFSLFIAMFFISFTMNLANYRTSIQLLHQVLNHIVENNGEISHKEMEQSAYLREEIGFTNAFKPHYQQYQYYSCIYDSDGNLLNVINHLDSQTDDSQIRQYASGILGNKRKFGRNGSYFYQIGETTDGNSLVVLIDGTMELSTATRLFYWTLLICVVGMLITLIFVLLFSGKIIEPEIENSRRQKQFITNASHELKTPLAVIRANVELQEIMNGETELTQSTLKQVDHMNGLIQNLVMIAKAAEKEDRSGMTDEDVSKLVQESVEQFHAVAKQERLELVEKIEPDIHMVLDGSKVQQLTTILIDNAIKYCDDNGVIRVTLVKIKKGVSLTVSNSYAEGVNVDYNRFFDRFYREDQSHNIDRGGYGIGLSIAESICKQNGGTIRAEWKNGEISFVCKLM